MSEEAEAVKVLREWLSHAECGLLDEIPSFKPDVYYNALVAKTVEVLALFDKGS